jgi:hypothetical protein
MTPEAIHDDAFPTTLPELPGLARGGDTQSHPQPKCLTRNAPFTRLERAGMVIVCTYPPSGGG